MVDMRSPAGKFDAFDRDSIGMLRRKGDAEGMDARAGTDNMRSHSTRTLRIEYDDIIYSLQRFGGITQYWQELTTGITFLPDFRVSRCTEPAWQRLFKHKSKANIFHSSYFRVASGKGVRNVITVHDMAFELGRVEPGLRREVACYERRRAYFAADALICVSESTRTDLLHLFPQLQDRVRIEVIHHGPTLKPGTLDNLPLDMQLGARSPFILFVGGRKAYKNFAGALEAFAITGLARQGMRMLCTGSDLTPSELAMIDANGLSGKVLSLGIVGRAALVDLYRQAHCLLYPSQFEGFGMPVLEAMMLGCPVVAAACKSIPEIAGSAALLIEDGEPEGLAAAVLSLCFDDVRQRLVEAGIRQASHFSWDRSIERHANLYKILG